MRRYRVEHLHLEYHLHNENTVRIHITVTNKTRVALRLVAAARGTSVADVLEHWALAEADSLGLHDIVNAVEGAPGPLSHPERGPSSAS